MSNYNTITSLSNFQRLIYAGTDDGFIQVTTNGGEQWTKIPITRLGLPSRSFVNDIKADLHDENTVYAVLDNHKEGDYNPYLYKSTDRGQTWVTLSKTLPKRTLLWRIVQDHVNKNLFFLATEFGVYTSLDGGVNCKTTWNTKYGLQRFGYPKERMTLLLPLRSWILRVRRLQRLTGNDPERLKQEGTLFAPRTAKWYVPRSNLGNTGADFYIADNPDFGAVFTYHLSKEYKTKKQLRKKQEKEANKKGANIPFPGYDALDEENNETPAKVWITISDAEGNIVRHLSQKAKKGSHRLTWDLRHSSTQAINPNRENRGWNSSGPMVVPGNYTAQLSIDKNGEVTSLGEAIEFEVKAIRDGVLKGVDYATYDQYRKELTAVQREMQRLTDMFEQAEKQLKGLKKAAAKTLQPKEIAGQLYTIQKELTALARKAEGSPAREEVGERNPPSIQTHMRAAYRGMTTTYGPTPLHRKSLALAKAMMAELQPEIERIAKQELPAVAKQLKAAGAPYIIGQE